MMTHSNSTPRRIFGTLVAGCFLLGATGMVLAQDDDDATAGPVHPAHILAGECAELDPAPVAALTDVALPLNNDEEDNDAQGVLTAPAVLTSETDDVDLSFEDDVLTSAHSIVVHESEENVQNYIACGEIGGIVVDGELLVSLHSMNDSGYSGIAQLSTDDDGQVDVEIFLAEPSTAPNEPDATPVS